MNEERPSTEEALPLSKAVLLLLEECRMVLPGIQALFGFQLIAVFNSRFGEALTPMEQRLHLLAIGMTALAVGLIMTPAAYHRQVHPRKATLRFVRISTKLVLLSMPPLALSLCTEFYLVSRLILHSSAASVAAGVLLGIFVMLWFVLPWLQKKGEIALLSCGSLHELKKATRFSRSRNRRLRAAAALQAPRDR